MTHHLYLIDNYKVDCHTGTTSFAQEENKKSSFILEHCPVNLCVQKQQPDESTRTEQTQTGLSASASISCSVCGSDDTSMFLFGGFEIIASIKSTEVFVTPSENATTATKQDKYVTTCRGIPLRLGEEEEDDASWFKFIFVLPGGPKPVNNVRLKFVGAKKISDSSCRIRDFKLKGRLPGVMPNSTTPKQQERVKSIPMPIISLHNARNGDGMASMMAQMRLSAMGQGMNREEDEKNQAEIISSIAGLGMFLKSSEERTINAMEKMISGMESRIMDRLDKLAARVATLEQSYNEKNSNARSIHYINVCLQFRPLSLLLFFLLPAQNHPPNNRESLALTTLSPAPLSDVGIVLSYHTTPP